MRIGRDHAGRPFLLPSAAVTQTFGILAKRRGGKSYTAKVMAEEFAAAKVPFVVLDPTGAWWGLRSSSDGEKPGLPAVILGGAHGDAPLEPTGGKIVADLVVDHPGFYVLDLEAFESNAAQDRFVTDFAVRLYRRKATSRDPLHLFIDEADAFVPQRPGPSQLPMLGAFESIVRRGGIRGLGSTLISQRAAVVNKNVLTQLDTLIILQTTGPQDQDAVKDWVQRNANPSQYIEFKDSLASLPRGTAWVYSPELDLFERVAIREGRTYNSSATPEVGEIVIEPRKLATVDLDAVRTAMAASIEKAKADDPTALRTRIRDLERDLVKERADNSKSIPVIERVEIPVPMIEPETLATIAASMAQLEALVASIHEAANVLAGQAMDIKGGMAAVRIIPVPRTSVVLPPFRSSPRVVPPRVVSVGVDVDAVEAETAALKAGARRMLDQLARHHPIKVTRSQWATLVQMKKTGGTFLTYLSTLKRAGYVVEADGFVTITDAGFGVAGEDSRTGTPMTGDEVRDMWRSKLKAGARAMLDVLIETYPNGVPRHELASRIEMAPTGGTFLTYLSTLRRNGLADVSDGYVAATPVVMGL